MEKRSAERILSGHLTCRSAESGKTVHIAATTCRMVTMADMISEAETQGLRVIESGLTNCEPEFDCMQYVLLQR